MKMKSLSVYSVLFAAFAAAGFLAVTSFGTVTVLNESEQPHASWAMEADTVLEQYRASDIIVRVQVVGQGVTRTIDALSGDDSLRNSAEKASRHNPAIPFTDSEVEILQVYRGDLKVGDRIEILQTGGIVDGKALQLEEDPLYQVGGELVLFLVDISGDSVHAESRQLFRAINPASRYDVLGDQISTVDFGKAAQGPQNLASLEAEINAAARSFDFLIED